MCNSSLVDYVKYSPYCRKMTNKKNSIITIHHMASNLSVEACGSAFQTRGGASNYGIDSNGRVGLYVNESDCAFTSNSTDNDSRAVTIEVANDEIGGDWHVSDKALAKLIDLCVDICQRNGIPYLDYTGDLTGNMTMHCWFASTGCPGAYLKSKFCYIANEVNKRLGRGFVIQDVSRYALGDRVKLTDDAMYFNGYSCPEWLKKFTLYIREVSGKYYTISTQATGSITGVVHEDFLIPMDEEKPKPEEPKVPVVPEDDAPTEEPAVSVPYEAKVTITKEKNGFGLIDGGGWIELEKVEKI